MTNPKIETDLAEILIRIDNKLDKLGEQVGSLKVGQAKLEGKIEALDEKLSGRITSVEEKLSGQISSVEEKLSGRITSVDTKVDQLDKRIANQEFTNRGVLVGLILALLGSAIKLFGWVPNS